MMLQLDPPVWLTTPKGLALAHVLIDPGIEHDLMWVCFVHETGEIWTFENPQVRAEKNITIGRTLNAERDDSRPVHKSRKALLAGRKQAPAVPRKRPPASVSRRGKHRRHPRRPRD